MQDTERLRLLLIETCQQTELLELPPPPTARAAACFRAYLAEPLLIRQAIYTLYRRVGTWEKLKKIANASGGPQYKTGAGWTNIYEGSCSYSNKHQLYSWLLTQVQKLLNPKGTQVNPPQLNKEPDMTKQDQTFTKLPVLTKPLAEALLENFIARFPHPITRVAWPEAGAANQVDPDLLITIMTELYANKGLDQTALAVLRQCGWRLAMIPEGGGQALILAEGSPAASPVEPPSAKTPEPPPAKTATRPYSHAVQDDSLAGQIFAMIENTDHAWTTAMVAARCSISSERAAQVLQSLTNAKQPRHGKRLVKTVLDRKRCQYQIRPW